MTEVAIHVPPTLLDHAYHTLNMAPCSATTHKRQGPRLPTPEPLLARNQLRKLCLDGRRNLVYYGVYAGYLLGLFVIYQNVWGAGLTWGIYIYLSNQPNESNELCCHGQNEAASVCYI